MARDKVRIRFRKAGDLRLVSHHDLLRCFERMLRRAGLPFHSTEGFNPKPRLVFALSLALGVVGTDEVLELELDEEVPPEEVQARLRQQAPPGLEILETRRIEPRTRAQVRSVTYRLALPQERITDLPARMAAVLADPECWIERHRPQPKRIALRPYLRALRLGPGTLEMDLWVTPTGAARPEEVLQLLNLADLLETGTVLERSRVELQDEIQASGERPLPELVPSAPGVSGADAAARQRP
jgi:radical SAM-linked protein